MKNQEKIDRYLSEQMNQQELEAFEQEIKQDEDLAQSLALQEELVQFFDTREPALEAELSSLGEQYMVVEQKKSGVPPWLLVLVGSMITILIGCYVFFKPSSSLSLQQESQSPTLLDDSLNIETITPPHQEKKLDTVPVSPEETKLNIPNIKQKKTSSEPPPIASIDPDKFKLNTSLEALVREKYRNNINFNLSFPKQDTVFRFQKNVPLLIQGTTNVSPPYELLVYTNRPFDFDNDYPVLKQLITGIERDDLYYFDFEANIPFDKGLYYLMIRTQEDSKMLSISTFMVK